MKELTIEITDRCPLNCLYCSTRAGKDGNRYISRDDVARYLVMFEDFDTVRISGGEPFEHPELEDILKTIKGDGRKTTVLSCGVTQREDDFPHAIRPERMKTLAPNIDELIFSIYGFYEVHDQIVTSDQNWTRQLPYWDMMIDSCENAQRARIPVSYHTVLMKSNFENLTRIALAVSRSRLEITPSDTIYHLHILRFVKQGRGEDNPDQALDEDQLNALPGLAAELEKRFNIRITYTNSFQQKVCDCGSGKAVVTIQGEIIPCSALKHSGETGKYACRSRI
ncbi:MAG: radical SAM protein [Nanoarchaeota archaeon]